MKKAPKHHVSVVVIGHVDSGKSTTTGHFVFKCGGVDKRTIEKFEKEAAEIGKSSFRYAWVLDRTMQERDRGITIDCTVTVIETEKIQCTLIDAPGHRDFMKNMISGASHADYGIFVVPASPGEFETATGTSGQLMQQATLAKTMGISYGIVVVNKMDLHNYDQSRYEEITKDVADRLRKIGYKPSNIAYIPLSGWVGDNIMEPSENTPWYKGWEYTYVLPDKTEKKISGKTLYEYIDSLNLPSRAENKPLRGSVSDTFKIGGVGTVTVGRIDSGKLKPGDVIHIVPGGITTEVKSIEMHHKPLMEAKPGDNVGFNLKNVSVADVRRGCVFGHQSNNPPREVERFTAQIMALEKIGDDRGIRRGMAPTLDVHTAHIPVVIDKIVSVVEKKSKKKKDEESQPVEEPPGGWVIKKDGSGVIELVPSKPLCVETYLEFPPLGRFSLRDSRITIGVGVVKSVVKKEEKGKQAGAAGPVKGKQAAKGGAKAKK